MIRILHLFGAPGALTHWVRYGIDGPSKKVLTQAGGHYNRAHVELWDGNEITRFDCYVIAGFNDVERVPRGIGYHAVMVDDSFHRLPSTQARNIDTYTLLYEVKAMVLR